MEASVSTLAQLGRGLQVIGLVLPPLAIMQQLFIANPGRISPVSPMLLMLGIAVCLFSIGRVIEGHARRR